MEKIKKSKFYSLGPRPKHNGPEMTEYMAQLRMMRKTQNNKRHRVRSTSPRRHEINIESKIEKINEKEIIKTPFILERKEIINEIKNYSISLIISFLVIKFLNKYY